MSFKQPSANNAQFEKRAPDFKFMQNPNAQFENERSIFKLRKIITAADIAFVHYEWQGAASPRELECPGG